MTSFDAALINPAQALAAFDSEAEFDSFDVLVNSSGAARSQAARQPPLEHWRTAADAKPFAYVNLFNPPVKRWQPGAGE